MRSGYFRLKGFSFHLGEEMTVFLKILSRKKFAHANIIPTNIDDNNEKLFANTSVFWAFALLNKMTRQVMAIKAVFIHPILFQFCI